MKLRRFSDRTIGVLDGEVLVIISATEQIDYSVLKRIREALKEQIKREDKMMEAKQKAKSKPTQDVRKLVNELKQGLEE